MRRRLGAERGSLLIEVMVGAVLVVFVSIAVAEGFDGAFNSAGRNKARSVAATLAEEDQERLRSFRVRDLSNFEQTQTHAVDGVDYTVTSRAEWVRDDTGLVSCTSDQTEAEYIKITSTAHAPILGATPVVTESLVSPPVGEFGPDRGTAAISVIDRDGQPVQGIRVDMARTGSALNRTTNELGCAVFGYVPAASDWTIDLTSADRVDPRGNRTAHKDNASVVAEATTPIPLEYDVAAQITVGFDTQLQDGSVVSSQGRQASVANPRLPLPGLRTFGGTSFASSVLADNLFPFSGGYEVFAGSCMAARPSGPDAQTTDPGQSYNVTVRQPALNVLVRNSDGTPRQGARVFVTPSPSSCGAVYGAKLTNSTGRLDDPGYPYGNYTICADLGASGDRRVFHPGSGTVSNADAAGTADLVMTLPASAGSFSNRRCQ